MGRAPIEFVFESAVSSCRFPLRPFVYSSDDKNRPGPADVPATEGPEKPHRRLSWRSF